jgi:hypothetical protein|tara:strand:- start:62 stop:745 length:684 start_codon:yes stop_codon:yes gene_type:complete
MGFDLLGYLKDRATEVGGTIQENLPGALRMAGDGLGLVKDQVMGLTGQAVDYVQDIPAKGAIPIPLTDVSKDARTGAGYLKSLAGPVGMPFRVMDNPGSSAFYQQAINAADIDDERGVVIFNEDMQNQDEYRRLGRDLSNKDFGQFVGKVMPNGDVMVDDDYDTNRSARWHYNRLMTGKSKEGDALTPLDRAISGASGLHKKLDQAGWTNPHPFGAPGSVRIGTYQR